MTNVTRRIVLSLILALVFVLTAAPLAGAQNLERLRLSEVVRSLFYAPQYVALELGFFRDEGFDIELSTAFGADKGAAALISGSVDIGFFGPEAAVYIYLQGARDYLVAFAQLTAMDGSFLMAREPTDNFQWIDLKGKVVVGARPGGVPQMMLEWIIRQHGMDPYEDMTMITNLAFEAAPGAFHAGLGDYIAQFEPSLSQIQKQGVGQVVASLGVDGGPIAYTAYHVRKSYLERNPDLLVRFTRALLRGVEWVETHSPEEVAEVVRPFFPDIDFDVLVSSLARYMEQGSWNPTLIPSEEGFANLQKVMMAAGHLSETVPFEVLMETEIARQALESYQK